MFNWLWEQLHSFGMFLWNLPLTMGRAVLVTLGESMPESVLADLAPLLEYLDIADRFIPLSEAFEMATGAFSFQIVFIGARTIFRLIRG